jgi:hypothetical protein
MIKELATADDHLSTAVSGLAIDSAKVFHVEHFRFQPSNSETHGFPRSVPRGNTLYGSDQAPAPVIEMLVTSDYWNLLPLLPCFAAWIDTRNRSLI